MLNPAFQSPSAMETSKAYGAFNFRTRNSIQEKKYEYSPQIQHI